MQLGNSEINLATPADDETLRRLMQTIDTPGAISIAFEREPSFFQAVEIEGDSSNVLVARVNNKVVGVVSLTQRNRFVNGVERQVSYLSTARIERAWRGRRVVIRVFAALRDILRQNNQSHFICTMARDNSFVDAFLQNRHRRLLEVESLERVCTLVVPTRRRRFTLASSVRQATLDDLPSLVKCLRCHARRRQFAVAWTGDDLLSENRTRGLKVSDFLVAEQQGQIVGCIAVWDQSAFKQSVITGYRGIMGACRQGINLVAPLFNVPQLPNPGEKLDYVYLSHLAVDEEDLELTMLLLEAACEVAMERGAGNVTLGFSERDRRLGKVHRHLGGIRYWTELCAVGFGGTRFSEQLDGRAAHLEIAVL